MAKGFESLFGKEKEKVVDDAAGDSSRLTKSAATAQNDNEDILKAIQSVEVEAVVAGVLQRVRFAPGTNPADIGWMLTSLDPNAKTRDSFPMKGGGGPRETKTATALVINVRVTDQGKFIDLVCKGESDDVSVGVSRKNADGWLPALAAIGKLSEAHLGKVEKAFSEKGSATVVLDEGERFGVKYWTSDDGRNYLESMV